MAGNAARRAAGNAPRISGGRSSPQPQQLECPVFKGRAGRDGGGRAGSGAPVGSRRRQLGFRARLPSPPLLFSQSQFASLEYSNGGGGVVGWW